MKTEIIITGQPQGNYTLKSALNSVNCEVKKHFQDYTIIFNTKKEAKEALKNAFIQLKNEEYDYYRDGGIDLYNDTLTYDASRAYIS